MTATTTSAYAPKVQLGVLGPFQVVGSPGRQIRSGRQAALLALLCAHRGGVPAGRLIDLLWSDEPAGVTTNTLQALITRVRQILGPATIAHDVDAYRLDLPVDAVDAWLFEDLVGEARRDARAGSPDAADDRLARALSLWRGPVPFEGVYPELLDAHELLVAAARLTDLRRQAVEEHADLALAAGRHRELVGELELVLASDPSQESITGRLMVALYRSGRAADALGAFARLRGTLAERGLEPHPQVRRLEEAVLRHSEELLLGAGGAAAPGGPRVAVTPYVGRDEETARARDALAAGRPVVITGEAGLGKSRALAELAAALRRDGRHVVNVRCEPDGGSFEVRPDVVRQVRPLSASPPGLPDVGIEEARGLRAALVDDVVASIAAAAALQRLVVFVDDAHWMDPTLAVLLRRLLLLPRVEIVVAARPDGGAVWRALLREALASAVVVELGPLDLAASFRLAGALLDLEGARAVAQASLGHPLLLEELARLAADGTLPADLPSDPPAAIFASVTERLDSCSEPARRTTVACAVTGLDVELRTLPAVLEATSLGVAAAIDEAVRRHLLIDDGEGRIRFAHELVRLGVLSATSPSLRAVLHERIGSALWGEATDVSGRIAAAQHTLAALPAVEVATALGRARAAAADAITAMRFEVADELLSAALALVEQAAPAPEEAAVVHAEAARAAGLAGDRHRARSLVEEALARAASTSSAVVEAEVLLTVQELGRSLDVDHVSLIRGVYARLPDPEAPVAEALGLHLVAEASFPTRTEDAEEVASALLERARRRGDPAGLARALAVTCMTPPARRLPSLRRDLAEELCRLGAEGDDRAAFDGLLNRAAALLAAGRASDALKEALRLCDLSDRRGVPREQWQALVLAATCATAVGDLDAARRMADDALGRGLRVVPADAEVTWAVHQYVAALHGHELDEVADTAAAFAGSRPAEVAWALAAALCRPDEQRAAEVALERYAAAAVRRPLDELAAVEAALAAWLASTHPSPGAVARSMEVLSAWPADMVCLGMPILCLGPRDRYLALGHAAVGDLDQASSLLFDAHAVSISGGAAAWATWCARDRGRLIRSSSGAGPAQPPSRTTAR